MIRKFKLKYLWSIVPLLLVISSCLAFFHDKSNVNRYYFISADRSLCCWDGKTVTVSAEDFKGNKIAATKEDVFYLTDSEKGSYLFCCKADEIPVLELPHITDFWADDDTLILLEAQTIYRYNTETALLESVSIQDVNSILNPTLIENEIVGLRSGKVIGINTRNGSIRTISESVNRILGASADKLLTIGENGYCLLNCKNGKSEPITIPEGHLAKAFCKDGVFTFCQKENAVYICQENKVEKLCSFINGQIFLEGWCDLEGNTLIFNASGRLDEEREIIDRSGAENEISPGIATYAVDSGGDIRKLYRADSY